MPRGDEEQARNPVTPNSEYLEGLVKRMEKVAESGYNGPRYSVVMYDARQKLGIGVVDYLTADIIHKLSGSHSKIPGWCYASKPYLADQLGVSRRSMFDVIDRLKKEGLVANHPERSQLLRTTRKWHENVEVKRKRGRPGD